MNLYTGWAPPFFWGEWVTIHQQINGFWDIDVRLDTLSPSPSTFDIELSIDSEFRIMKLVGPCDYTVQTNNCACTTKARFKSHSVRQLVEVKVS